MADPDNIVRFDGRPPIDPARLRRIYGDPTEQRLRDDRPDLYEWLRPKPPTWRDDLADDWRAFIADVRAKPYSHALVALAAVIFWTSILVAPTLIGAWG